MAVVPDDKEFTRFHVNSPEGETLQKLLRDVCVETECAVFLLYYTPTRPSHPAARVSFTA